MGSGAMHAAGHIQDPDNTQGHTFTVGSLSHGARSDLYDGVLTQSESHVSVCYKI